MGGRGGAHPRWRDRRWHRHRAVRRSHVASNHRQGAWTLDGSARLHIDQRIDRAGEVMTRSERERFDRLLELVLESLPGRIKDLLEEAPLIVDDRPSEQLLQELGIESDQEILCGLHSGTPLTHRSVEHGHDLPETIHIFREGVLDEAGGWEPWTDDDGEPLGGEDRVRQEIRITLLHEIGHHFGLDEDDLAKLGYD